MLLRVMLGGSRRPDLVDGSEDEALRLAQRELAPVLGVVAAPLVTAVYRWPAAIAQYTIGHRERRECVERSVGRHAGLAICGTSYDGVSLNDAVKSGRQAATGVAARLWGESRTAAAVVPMLVEARG